MKINLEALDNIWTDDLEAITKVRLVIRIAAINGRLETKQLGVILNDFVGHRHGRYVDHVDITVCTKIKDIYRLR